MKTDIRDILTHVDHTLLKQTAIWEDIRELCDDGIKYHTASVCIPPSFVKRAAEYVRSKDKRLKICTVIGFPNGYNTSAVKVFETKDAISNGADEIDMVINLGQVKAGRFDFIRDEISAVRAACSGRILKIIIETCLLSREERIELCHVVTEAKADYIKTSTGFAASGATFDDVRLFREHIGPEVKIKAAGGISSIEDAEEFLALGADRLGTSRIVKLAKLRESPN